MDIKNYEIVDSVEKLEAAIAKTKAAQSKFAQYTQEQVDKIFLAAASAADKARIPLARMAVEETGMGVVEDKVIKNHYAAEYIYNAYKDTKTCGVIEEDKAYGIKKIAEPIGVIAAVTVCSHLFGFIGMVIGVPLCAVFTYLFSKFLDSRLKKKNLPSDTKLYRSKDLYSNKEFINASIEVEATNLIEKSEEESTESSSNIEHKNAVHEMYEKILYERSHPEHFPAIEIDEAVSDEADDYTEDI